MKKEINTTSVRSYSKLGIASNPDKNKMSVKLGRNKYTYGFIDVSSAKGGGICRFDYLCDSELLVSLTPEEGEVAWVTDKDEFMMYDGYDWVDATDYNDKLKSALFRLDDTLYYYSSSGLNTLSTPDLTLLEERVSTLETKENNLQLEVDDLIIKVNTIDLYYEKI